MQKKVDPRTPKLAEARIRMQLFVFGELQVYLNFRGSFSDFLDLMSRAVEDTRVRRVFRVPAPLVKITSPQQRTYPFSGATTSRTGASSYPLVSY